MKTVCEWCFNGACEYSASYEEQVENETFWDCDGTVDDMLECGMVDTDKAGAFRPIPDGFLGG